MGATYTIHKRKCFSCKEEFRTKHSHQKYCGSLMDKVGCSFKIAREYSALWSKKNKDRVALHDARYRAKDIKRYNKLHRGRYKLMKQKHGNS